MRFEKQDLEFELPSIKEFLTNCPSEQIRMSPTLMKGIFGPSPKGYITLVTERYKVFVHRNSVAGKWILEQLGRIQEDSICLFLQPTSPDGRGFEIFEEPGTMVRWEISPSASGLVMSSPTPSSKKRLELRKGSDLVKQASRSPGKTPPDASV